MCRFTLYLGPALPLSTLLLDPGHSLIQQSWSAQERPRPTNGDGFGFAWYVDDRAEPARFRSVTPAWRDGNAENLARVTASSCVLAHVRAATVGHTAGEANCHPFAHGPWSFMHNGALGSFRAIRRRLLSSLSDVAFDAVQGQTDTEHLFGVVLDRLPEDGGASEVQAVGEALEAALHHVLSLSREAGDEHSILNLALSNGRVAVATRFTTEPDHDGESLYVNHGQRYTCVDGVCAMREPDERGAATLISSEPLSAEVSWQRVPRNHMVLVDGEGGLEIRELRVQA